MANEASMYGTRRASRHFQEQMTGDLGEAGYAALKVSPRKHCLEADSMAETVADVIGAGEPREVARPDAG